jgi:hypothetical protein
MITTIKRNLKKENSFEIKMTGVTSGKILAMLHAFANSQSPVVRDVHISLRNGIETSNDLFLKKDAKDFGPTCP